MASLPTTKLIYNFSYLKGNRGISVWNFCRFMVFRDITAKTRRSLWLHCLHKVTSIMRVVKFWVRSDVNAFHLVGNTNKRLTKPPVKCPFFFSLRRLPDIQSMCFILPFLFRWIQSPVKISGLFYSPEPSPHFGVVVHSSFHCWLILAFSPNCWLALVSSPYCERVLVPSPHCWLVFSPDSPLLACLSPISVSVLLFH